MKKIIFLQLFLSVSLLLLLSCTALSGSRLIEQKSPIMASQFQKKTKINSVSFIPYSDLWESAWVWVDSSGWVNARAEVQSRSLAFGEQNLNDFIQIYPQSINIFDHASWWFRPTGDPTDHNADIEIQFRSSDNSLCRTLADLIIDYTNAELGLNYEFTGSYAWDDWRGDAWVSITSVCYSAHADWPWFTDFINDKVIPRNVGGLAETIDVTDAGHISAWAWPSFDDEGNVGIILAFGFEFHYDIYNDISGSYFGTHTLNMNELIHTSQIQCSQYQDQIHLNYALPDVTNLVTTPQESNSIEIQSEYHPSSEPGIHHHFWDVSIKILAGSYSDLSVSFTYDFIPWYLRSRTSTELLINHYGYQAKNIYLQGEYAQLMDLQSLSQWDSTLVMVELNLYPQRTILSLPDHLRTSFQLSLYYPDHDDHIISASNLATEIATDLGISYHGSDSWEWNWWDNNHYGIAYNFYSNDLDSGEIQFLLSDSSVITSTPLFDNQDLSTVTEIRYTSAYYSDVNQWTQRMDFRWNPLAEEIAFPVKIYEGDQPNVAVDLLNEWSWSTFPYCSNYSESEFSITIPSTEAEVYPAVNNGWGWNINEWRDDHGTNVAYSTYNLQLYTDPTSLEFVNEFNEPNGILFEEFGLNFGYDFHDDSVDLNPPCINILYRDKQEGDIWDPWPIQIQSYSGLETNFYVWVSDDCGYGIHGWHWPSYYWNGDQYVSRFGTSGIDIVTVTAYFGDLPVFEQSLPLTCTIDDDLSREYQITWNTDDSFADGEWTLVAFVEDKAGLMNSYSLTNLLVDNYNDETYTIAPSISVLSDQNTTVSGEHTIQAEITDDIGIFGVVITRSADLIILEDPDNDGVYEFLWDTSLEVNTSIHILTITAWDLDGHKSIYGYWLDVNSSKQYDDFRITPGFDIGVIVVGILGICVLIRRKKN